MTDPFRPKYREGVEAIGPKFPLVPFEQLIAGTGANYLVKGLIPRVGLTVVWGKPKCWKSFWAFDIAMHIALGRDYRGRCVVGGSVVYCAVEGADGMGRRAKAFRMRFLPDPPETVPLYMSRSTIDLIEDHAALIDSIRVQAPNPKMVVVDTLNRSLRGSESSD